MEKKEIKKEITAGITTAFALVPESIAFGFVLGVDPMVALYTSFILGIVLAFIGGRPGLISGAAGSVAVIFVPLVLKYGVEYLFYAVILMGIIQFIFGFLNFSKYSTIIPKAVMLGFVNGLAIIILKSQIELINHDKIIEFIITISLIIITILIIKLVPKKLPQIPVQLLAILVVSIISITINNLGLHLPTVEDFAGKTLTGGLPQFHIPQISNIKTVSLIVLPYSFMAAFVGIIESTLTLNLVDQYTKTHGNTKKEVMAQGVANITCGFFSGMGGCAMVGQTVVNLQAGGRKYLSGATTALTILFLIIFLPNLLGMIPLAVLIGIMFVVVYETFAWESVLSYKYIKKQDMFVVFTTTILTIFTNLAVAVIVGIIIASLIFVWEKSKKIIVIKTNELEDVDEYKILGILFFASVTNVKKEIEIKDKDLIIDLKECRLQDYASVDMLEEIAKELLSKKRKLKIKGCSLENYELIKSHSKFEFSYIEDKS